MEENRPMYNYISYMEVQEFLETCSAAAYKELECHSCNGYCHPPFRACSTRHFICQMCYSDNKVCELCQSAFSTERLLFLEKVHAFLDFPCVNLKHGCSFQGRGEEIIYHQEQCPYMIISCPKAGCKWQGKPVDLFAHYDDHHPSNMIENETLVKRVCEKSTTGDDIILTNIVQEFDHIFLVILSISLSQKCIRFIATNLESFKEVNNFELCVDFLLNDGTKWTLQGAFRFTGNKAERAISEAIQCDEICEFRKSVNPNAYFDHFIIIKERVFTMSYDDSDESDEDYDSNESGVDPDDFDDILV